MIDISNSLILAYSVYLVGVVSPGPSNLAIMGIAMESGRKPALVLAFGIICGSLFWGMLAAFGLSAILATYSNLLIAMKIIGGIYLFWLAYKSGRSALSNHSKIIPKKAQISADYLNIFGSGLAIHITNPKAIFVWLSIVSFAMPIGSQMNGALNVVFGCASIGIFVFCSYAMLFSTPMARRIYKKLRRWFEGALALMFGYAGIRMLTSEL
ncbi:MAG: LysE family translocator [Methylococcales bacterium]